MPPRGSGRARSLRVRGLAARPVWVRASAKRWPRRGGAGEREALRAPAARRSACVGPGVCGPCSALGGFSRACSGFEAVTGRSATPWVLHACRDRAVGASLLGWPRSAAGSRRASRSPACSGGLSCGCAAGCWRCRLAAGTVSGRSGSAVLRSRGLRAGSRADGVGRLARRRGRSCAREDYQRAGGRCFAAGRAGHALGPANGSLPRARVVLILRGVRMSSELDGCWARRGAAGRGCVGSPGAWESIAPGFAPTGAGIGGRSLTLGLVLMLGSRARRMLPGLGRVDRDWRFDVKWGRVRSGGPLAKVDESLAPGDRANLVWRVAEGRSCWAWSTLGSRAPRAVLGAGL